MKKGFTLIELLVVIAIISILASMLMPVFARARGKARQTACLSNQSQLVKALLMYGQDYDESMPYGMVDILPWWEAIQPYSHNRQILQCPDRKSWAVGFGLNYSASGRGVGEFWDPASKILLADAEDIFETTGIWWVNDPVQNPVLAGDNPSDPRHNDGSNFGFADGHVKWARPEAVSQPFFWIPEVSGE